MLERFRGRDERREAGRDLARGFRLRLRVVSVENVDFQRHPPGALERWKQDPRGLNPPTETVPLTIAHLEPVDEHGDYTRVGADGLEAHARGYLDVRTLHATGPDALAAGQEFFVTLSPVEGG